MIVYTMRKRLTAEFTDVPSQGALPTALLVNASPGVTIVTVRDLGK